MKFKKTETVSMQIMYEDKQIHTAIETKFLGLVINNTFSWKTHIECIKSKLSFVCYAMQSVKPFISKYSDNNLLFLLPLCNDLQFIFVVALLI